MHDEFLMIYVLLPAGVASNTDAAYLAETFAEAKCPTKVHSIVCFIMLYSRVFDILYN